jgi:DNA-binding LytR/AlgR family response regulator
MSPLDRTEVTALIVEDESALAEELREALTALWPALRVVGVAPDGVSALGLFVKHSPDIVFLDIQIPDPNGLEVARMIGDRAHIAFITAYDAFAIEAFEQGALDYVLKPIHHERLLRTVQRLQQRLRTIYKAPLSKYKHKPRANVTCDGLPRRLGVPYALLPSTRSSSSSRRQNTRASCWPIPKY